MAYSYPTPDGELWLEKSDRGWILAFGGEWYGPWVSADAAARDIASGEVCLRNLGDDYPLVSADLIDWRPFGDSL